TKIKWALEDSMELSIAAQRRMRRILAWMEETRAYTDMDVRVTAHLGQLEHELFGLALDVTELERVVTAACQESKPRPEGTRGKLAVIRAGSGGAFGSSWRWG